MKIENQAIVKFSKEFITPSGLKEWVGIEWPFDAESESPYVVLDKAQDYVCGWWRSRQGPQGEPINPITVAPSPVINRAHERLKDLLADCTNLQQLSSYYDAVKDANNPEVTKLYDKIGIELFQKEKND